MKFWMLERNSSCDDHYLIDIFSSEEKAAGAKATLDHPDDDISEIEVEMPPLEAAAPDLLEACRLALADLAAYRSMLAASRCESYIPNLDGLIGRLDAAIAKATPPRPSRSPAPESTEARRTRT